MGAIPRVLNSTSTVLIGQLKFLKSDWLKDLNPINCSTLSDITNYSIVETSGGCSIYNSVIFQDSRDN